MNKGLSIRDQLQTKDLFEAFKVQLKKDFDECACDSSFVDTLEPDFDEIKRTLTKELKINEKRSHFNLQQLLYRIDINEKQLKDHINEQKNDSYLEVISELIIKRILQKVVLKIYFKNK